MLFALPASAQQTRPRSEIGIAGGVAQFDLAGTGTTPFAALRLDRELTSWLIVDGALGLLRPDEQITVRRTYLVPEAQLQLQLANGTIRPYLGAGVGYLTAVSGASRSYGIVSGSGGARVSVSPLIDVRGELRVTGVSATLAQWTLGLARRF
jgi:outer membrane protein W